MFIYRNWEVVSKGNPYAHAILRGYMNKKGQSLPNYHYEDLKLVCDMYHKAELQNPAIIVDVNHANSGKKSPRRCCNLVRSARMYTIWSRG